FTHCGESAIDADDCVGGCSDSAVCGFQMSNRRVEINPSAPAIEIHTDVGITLCRLDYCRVERGASDRVDTFLGINVVWRKVQRTRSIMDHPAAHWDRVSQRFLGDPDLFERMDPACRNGQVNGASADNVPFARISAPLVQIHLVPASSQIRCEQSACETAADQSKFRHSPGIYESGTQAAMDAKQRPGFQSRKSPITRMPSPLRRRLTQTPLFIGVGVGLGLLE